MKKQETTTTKFRDTIEGEPGFSAGVGAIRAAKRDTSGPDKSARRCGVLAQEGIAINEVQKSLMPEMRAAEAARDAKDASLQPYRRARIRNDWTEQQERELAELTRQAVRVRGEFVRGGDSLRAAARATEAERQVTRRATVTGLVGVAGDLGKQAAKVAEQDSLLLELALAGRDRLLTGGGAGLTELQRLDAEVARLAVIGDQLIPLGGKEIRAGFETSAGDVASFVIETAGGSLQLSTWAPRKTEASEMQT